MTSTDIAVIDGSELAALAAQAGASAGYTGIPLLRVNMNEVDDQDRELKKGTFVLPDEDGENVYAKTATIRPLTNLFRMREVDPETKKLVGRTVLVKSFREEMIDTKGSVRLGKPSGAVFKELSAERQAKYENIKTERVVYAIAELTGVTASGEERTIGPIGVQMILKGANFMGFEDEVVKKLPKQRNLFDYQITLSTEGKTNGSLRYFIIKYAFDPSSPLPTDVQTFNSLKSVLGLIDEENASVRAKYDAALRGNQEDTDADEFHNDSMDDDIPF